MTASATLRGVLKLLSNVNVQGCREHPFKGGNGYLNIGTLIERSPKDHLTKSSLRRRFQDVVRWSNSASRRQQLQIDPVGWIPTLFELMVLSKVAIDDSIHSSHFNFIIRPYNPGGIGTSKLCTAIIFAQHLELSI